MKKNINSKIIYYFLIFLPFIDLLSSLMRKYNISTLSVGIVIKGIFLAYIVFYILFISKSKYKKVSITYFILSFIYILMFFITKSGVFQLYNLYNEIIYLFKYFYFPFVFLGFLNLIDNKDFDKDLIKKVLLYNVLTYTYLIILPFITGTSFKSYIGDNEGSVGWFYSANEISAIFLMIFPFIFKYLKSGWKYIYIFLAIFAGYIMGTKVSWLGIIIICIYFLIISLIKKEKFKSIKTLLIVIFTIIITFFSPTVTNMNNKIEELNKKVYYCSKPIYYCNAICEEENTKFLKIMNLIFNGREVKAKYINEVFSNIELNQKLFGLGFTNRDEINNDWVEQTAEIDYLDIYFHYGIIGFFVIMYPFIFTLIKVIVNIKRSKINKDIVLDIFMILLVCAVALFAGHIIGYPAASIYLSIYLVLILINTKVIGEVNEKNSNLSN